MLMNYEAKTLSIKREVGEMLLFDEELDCLLMNLKKTCYEKTSNEEKIDLKF